MILGITQEKSQEKKLFTVTEDGFRIYTAEAPWEDELTISDENGQAVCTVTQSQHEDIPKSLSAFEELLADSQKLTEYSVNVKECENSGKIFIEQGGLWESRIFIPFKDRLLTGYRVGTGFDEIVTFYDGETVVGQLTKSSVMIAENKNNYMLHFIDEYKELKPVLAFFAIYYDFTYHKGEDTINGNKALYKKSLSKNVEKYDFDFISKTFGEDAVTQMNTFFKGEVKKTVSKNAKLNWTLVGIGVGLAAFMAYMIIFVFN